MGTALFIGTCRVIEPARTLRDSLGKPALPMRHRLHNPHQIEQAIRMLSGSEPVFDQSSIHLMSERSCKEALSEPDGPERVLSEFNTARQRWADHEMFVIEISSVKDFFVDLGGHRLSVNTHAARDLGRHAESLESRIGSGSAVAVRPSDVQMERMAEPDILAAMRRIKDLLGARPIIWVGHINVGPPGRAGEQPYPSRKALSDTLENAAEALGDSFFDQTEVVRQLGQEVALADNG
jgi:hypothetical protein